MVIEGDIETLLEAESDAEGLDEIEREHYEQIKSLNILVGEAAYIHDIKKHEAKAAKDHWEGLQLRLSSLISEGPTKPDPQQELSFSQEFISDFLSAGSARRAGHHRPDPFRHPRWASYRSTLRIYYDGTSNQGSA